MKKILMTVSSCATLIGGYACDYQSEDYRIVDHMLRFGTSNSRKVMENYKDETIYPYENYCLNLALSLASLKDKKLVDIADKTIQEIKKNVIKGGKINHTCSNDPNSSENEYGITKDGVVRYDRQKNLSIIKDLLDKIGFDGQYVIENAQNIIDDELEKLEEDEP